MTGLQSKHSVRKTKFILDQIFLLNSVFFLDAFGTNRELTPSGNDRFAFNPVYFKSNEYIQK